MKKESPIIQKSTFPNGMNNNQEIVVSVRCTVYNHGPFLRQCLDGIIMQQADFRYEAFVHDDASTDESAAIIREYADKYPDIIKPYFEKENLYSKKDGRFRALTYSPSYLRGKYISLCEGDDYWTDPLKLQKQVSYLETHPECAMVFGNALEHWEGTNKPDRIFSNLTDRDYDPDETSRGWIIPTATVMFRREVLNTELYAKFSADRKIITGDLPLWLTCATVGTLHGFSDIFSVYRRLPSGFMLKMHAEHRIAMGEHREEIYKVFGNHYKDSTLQMAMVHYRLAMSYAKKEHNPRAYFLALWKSISIRLRHPYIAVRHFLTILKQRKERLSS